MGSFMGHLLPGIIFQMFGLWLAFKYPYRYFVKRPKTKKLRSCRCNLDVVEGASKILLPFIGIIAEQFHNHGPVFHLTDPSNGEYWDGNIWSHCTMYMFFLFAGITDLLLYKYPHWIPRGTQYLALALAEFVEGYLFYFHTHGRVELDVRLHVLLLFAIWGGAGALILLCFVDSLCPKNTAESKSFHKENANEYELLDSEMDVETTPLNDNSLVESDPVESAANIHKLSNGASNGLTPELKLLASIQQIIKPNKPTVDASHLEILLQFSFTVSILLQGTWFLQIATILYPPRKKGWDGTVHENVTFATIFFTWHLASIIVFVSIAYFIVGFVSSKRKQRAGQ